MIPSKGGGVATDKRKIRKEKYHERIQRIKSVCRV